jgi:hypothetical protein
MLKTVTATDVQIKGIFRATQEGQLTCTDVAATVVVMDRESGKRRSGMNFRCIADAQDYYEQRRLLAAIRDDQYQDAAGAKPSAATRSGHGREGDTSGKRKG